MIILSIAGASITFLRKVEMIKRSIECNSPSIQLHTEWSSRNYMTFICRIICIYSKYASTNERCPDNRREKSKRKKHCPTQLNHRVGPSIEWKITRNDRMSNRRLFVCPEGCCEIGWMAEKSFTNRIQNHSWDRRHYAMAQCSMQVPRPHSKCHRLFCSHKIIAHLCIDMIAIAINELKVSEQAKRSSRFE